MPAAAKRLRRFWSELKRRHIIRVVVAYAAVAWLAVQIAEATFEPLGLEPRALTLVVVLALLGFPVAAVLAWFLQVSRETSPEVAGAERRPVVVATLPAPATPLVGREREIEEAERAIGGEGCRVLTIVGPAGVGKTRLSLELGLRLGARFPNGVCFAAAGALRTAEPLPYLLAERLGVGFAAGEDPWAATLGFLREKRLLLIIDNFEQLVSASMVVGEIASAAPGVVVVVTSRERLDLRDETVLRLHGLAVPPADAAGTGVEYEAVRLFAQSARRVDRGFAIDAANASEVGRICRLVEGLPLALELAGACVGVLSPADIGREIELRHDFPLGSSRDAPARHHSLRAAFESSWSLLDAREREVFRRLSVFHGGFTRPEADAVAGADLRLLAALVDKSLLRAQDAGRFDMLDIVRQFGREKLAADPEEERAVRARHAEHCAGLLEELVRRWDAGEVEAALTAVAPDSDNIRVAWAWAIEHRDAAWLGRAAEGLFRLWEARGWIEEGRALFGAAVEAVGSGASPALVGGLLARQGAFAEVCGAQDEAAEILERARGLLDAPGSARDLALALHSLSFVARARGDLEEGRVRARESLSLFERVGDQAGIAAALNSLGAHSYYLGDYAAAKRHFRESIARYRRSGDDPGVWKPLNNLAGVAVADQDYAEARRLLRQALEHHRRRMNRPGMARALQNLGIVAYRAGDHAEAEARFDEALAASRDAGARDLVAQGMIGLGDVRVARGDEPGAIRAYADAIRTAAEVRDLPLALTVLVGVARLQLRRGEPAPARRLLHLARLHPAADADTRRDAERLLEEIGGEPAAAPGDVEAADVATIHELALAVMDRRAPAATGAD